MSTNAQQDDGEDAQKRVSQRTNGQPYRWGATVEADGQPQTGQEIEVAPTETVDEAADDNGVEQTVALGEGRQGDILEEKARIDEVAERPEGRDHPRQQEGAAHPTPAQDRQATEQQDDLDRHKGEVIDEIFGMQLVLGITGRDDRVVHHQEVQQTQQQEQPDVLIAHGRQN